MPTQDSAIEKLDPATDGASPNIVAQNLEVLRGLFPDAFTESSDDDGPRWRLDFDALRSIVGDYSEDANDRYSFTWHGKARARRIAQTPSTGTLRPCPEESVDWDSTQNLFIEGDNLEVLKLLQKAYHKSVKMIYIDPPYNTGNEFIYPDKYQDNLSTYLRYTGQIDAEGLKLSANAETSGRYHTNWLNMMYPRLRLARNLLRDDGVLVVSIDDHEAPRLRLLCDELFGEENFVANVVWQKKYSPQNDARYFSDMHDHILVYARNKDIWRPNALPRTEEQNAAYKNPDNDPRGPWKATDSTCNKSRSQRPNLYYAVKNPNGGEVYPDERRVWAYSRDEFERLDSDDRVWWGADGTNSKPAFKSFLSEVKSGRVPTTVWSYEDAGHNQLARQELNELLPGNPFDTPKPTKLIEYISRICTTGRGSEIVLDFFSGSNTTGHAIFNLNEEDAGDRRFILVQLPETIESDSSYQNVADLGRQRLVEAMKGIESDSPRGFRVFKLDSSNIYPWDADFETLDESLFNSVENIKPDRSESDVLYELLLKFGLDLAVPIEEREIAGKKVFIIGAGALVVSLADEITLDVVEGIAALKNELRPEVMRVVLKDAGFQDDVVKTNAVQILRQHGVDDIKSL